MAYVDVQDLMDDDDVVEYLSGCQPDDVIGILEDSGHTGPFGTLDIETKVFATSFAKYILLHGIDAFITKIAEDCSKVGQVHLEYELKELLSGGSK